MDNSDDHARLLKFISRGGRKLFIFDYDDTIALTSELHAESFRAVLREYACDFNYSDVAGLTTEQALRTIFDAAEILPAVHDVDIKSLVTRKRQVYLGLVGSRDTTRPGIVGLLKKLNIAGHASIILSNGSSSAVYASLDRNNLAEYFVDVICAQDVESPKPSPSGIIWALGKHGFGRENSIVIDDSQIGFEAARRAGIQCVDINRLDLWHFSNPSTSKKW